MHDFSTVLVAVVPVFCIAIAGVILRRFNWLTEEADKSLMRLTINLLAPALIFDSILSNQALKQFGNVFLAPVIGFCGVALGMGVALVVRRAVGVQGGKVLGTFALGIGMYNYGYIPVPLCKTLFPNAPDTLGVLFAHNLGVEVAQWTLGLMLLGGGTANTRWTNMLNGPVVAILISLAINLCGGERFIPTSVSLAARMLGQCAVPMGLILIGAIIADHLHEFSARAGWNVIIGSCVLRMGVMPILFFLVAKFLPCSPELKRVIVLQGAMPSATFCVLLAKHFDGDPPTALRSVIATSVVGLVTIPFWIRVGLKFVGV
jgi:predicted permease